MKKSTYMDRAMKSRDPRFARVLGKLGYERRDMVAEASQPDDLAELRKEYEALIGKRPYMGWGADELREKIASAAAGGE
ncbi:hypothetical protein PE067_09350 [Paracoccus sp. DMF-8]|uniref:hypothetical protein n=1 Tax=Paracoccus sp. DMF-8 TaxID=3019445 RepID=UPI0023E79868|nr:hypothetical protein [Paracoccus sp. DMF-8]MDF3606324.1 hypothetical protein [Paracoccus sp. DMF-8]